MLERPPAVRNVQPNWHSSVLDYRYSLETPLNRHLRGSLCAADPDAAAHATQKSLTARVDATIFR
jgi:hypothetical protein